MVQNDRETPSADEANAALESVAKMTSAGLRHGMYPRWFAAAAGLWTGALAALIAFQSSLWILLFVVGVTGFARYRQRRAAWVQEVHSWREAFVVAAAVVVVCAIAVVGIVGWRDFGQVWAPIGAGAVIAAGVFTLLEASHRPARARIDAENDS